MGEAIFRKGDTRLKPTDIDVWYEEMLGNEVPKPVSRPYLYGKDAGYCARRNVLLEHNTWIDGNVNAAGKGYMAMGVALENLLAESLLRNDRLLGQSVRLPECKQLKVSGKIDLVIFDHNDELALVEVKTCGDLPHDIQHKPDYVAQIQTYAAFTGIKKCYLTYVSRKLNPLQPIPMKTFEVDTSEEAMLAVLTVAAMSRIASDSKTLPPTPAHFTKHRHCHYCEFRDYYCHGSRPGLGGDAPVSPMQEIQGGEYFELLSLAQALAMDIYHDTKERSAEFHKTLLGTVPDESWHDYALRRLYNELVEPKDRITMGEI